MDGSVLILGGGINGASIARELAMRGVPAVVVDCDDLACGATSRSSRLIHGGVRYLEYAEFSLVREALHDRAHLLRCAPHLVKPLRFFIPLRSRFSGLRQAICRFLGWPVGPRRTRGMTVVRFGLWLYDRFSRERDLPGARVVRGGDDSAPRVDAAFRWQAVYDDAQVLYPERLVVELLLDAQAAAGQTGAELHVFTHTSAQLSDGAVKLTREKLQPGGEGEETVAEFRPSLIVNATGAWVDRTLRALDRDSRRLIGGTKGSHLLTYHAPLREALRGGALYAEAADGRPVFVLPLGDGVMIGTTDEPFEDPPDQAVCTATERDYLIATVNSVIPGVGLESSHVVWTYCGVRPLPFVDSDNPASTTRRHSLREHEGSKPPLLSVIGGKITTYRSLGEEAAGEIANRLKRQVDPQTSSTDRLMPGAPIETEDEPTEASPPPQQGLAAVQVDRLAAVFGRRGEDVAELVEGDPGLAAAIGETDLPLAAVPFVVANEWATSLEDVVERRLMLLYDRRFSRSALEQVADQLVQCGCLEMSCKGEVVEQLLQRWEEIYHFHVDESRPP